MEMFTSIAIVKVSLDLFGKSWYFSLDGILGHLHILVDLGPKVVVLLGWAGRCFS